MKQFKKVVQGEKYKTLSPLERKIVDELIKYATIKLKTNYQVGPYFVDIAFPKHKVALEIDGYDYHSSEQQTAKDELRQQYLEEVQGWKIERVAGWFCFRYPQITVGKVLRHIPEAQGHPLFMDAVQRANQWYARDLINRGHKAEAIKVLGGKHEV